MEETNKSIDCSAYWESTKLSLFQSLKKMRIFLQRHIWFQVLYHMKLYISLHKVVKTWYIGFLSMSCHWAFAITNSLLLFHITSSNEWRGDELRPRSKNYISFSWDMPWISLQDICRTKKAESAIKLREIQLCNSAVDFLGCCVHWKKWRFFKWLDVNIWRFFPFNLWLWEKSVDKKVTRVVSLQQEKHRNGNMCQKAAIIVCF